MSTGSAGWRHAGQAQPLRAPDPDCRIRAPNDWRNRRPLSRHQQTRRWWHGRGVSRHRLAAEPGGGAEAPAGTVCERQGADGPVPPRGAGPGLAQSPEHRGNPRPGRVGHPQRAGDGAGRRRRPVRAPQTRADPVCRGARDRAADCRGARGRARQGDHPPRPQARQRQGHTRGTGQGPRLRPRQGARGQRHGPGTRFWRGGHPHRRVGHSRRDRHGHGGLHEPGAGERIGGRQALGHLVVRRGAVRAAGRPSPLRGRDDVAHDGRRAARGDRLEPVAGLDPQADPPVAGTVPRARPQAATSGHRRGAHHHRGLPGECVSLG